KPYDPVTHASSFPSFRSRTCRHGTHKTGYSSLLSHQCASVCLTCSKKQTAALAATFSDSTCPRCGMATRCVAAVSNASSTPCPSCPNSHATGADRSSWYSDCSVCELVTITGIFASLIRAANSTPSKISSTKCAPIPARNTLGDHACTVPALQNTCFTPAAAALRKMEPRLPGSCTRSSNTDACVNADGTSGIGVATTN